MTTLEERLPFELTQVADKAVVTFTIDDVVCASSGNGLIDGSGPSVQDRPQTNRVLVAAAGLAVIAGGLALYQSPTQSEITTVAAPGPDGVATMPQSPPTAETDAVPADPATTTAIPMASLPTAEPIPDSTAVFVPFGRELSLVRSDDDPTVLRPGAVVLDADRVGRIEVDTRSPLVDASTDRTANDTSETLCITQFHLNADEGRLTTCHHGRQSESVWPEVTGSSTFSQVVQDHGVYDGRTLFTVMSHDTESGFVLLGNVPDEIAFIEIASLLPYYQVPQNGVAALPFTPPGRDASDYEVKIKGYDSQGTLNLFILLEYVHAPIPDCLDGAIDSDLCP